MPINLIPNPASTPTSASQWTAFVAREDIAAIGGGVNLRVFTLTNESTTARPEVAIGSIIEVGGSWYQADSDTALTDDVGLIDGLVHIKLVPTGATVVPYLTSDAIPAWDSEKGGWYDGDDKFLPFEMTRSGAITKVYTAKCEWINQSKTVKICNDGSVGLDGSLTVGGAGTFGSGLAVGGNLGISGALSGVTTLSAGSITSGSVTSGSSALKWKTFTGTMSDTSASFLHGLTVANIVGMSFVVKSAGEDLYLSYYARSGLDASVWYTSTTVNAELAGIGINNQPYRCVVFYI